MVFDSSGQKFVNLLIELKPSRRLVHEHFVSPGASGSLGLEIQLGNLNISRRRKNKSKKIKPYNTWMLLSMKK